MCSVRFWIRKAAVPVIVLVPGISLALQQHEAGGPPQPTSQPAPAVAPLEHRPTPSSGPNDVPVPVQPSAEDIIRRFQEQRPTLDPILPAGSEDERYVRSTPAELEAAPASRSLLPEGYMLVDRAGRLDQDGPWWVFVFEGDNESKPEPPLKMLPNRLLERMVRESQGGAAPATFILSAEVTDFRGENFLLARKVLRKRDLGNLSK